MKVSILCLALNLGFALWLVHPYSEAGLGVANTLSACFNLLLLTYALRRKLARLGLTSLKNTLLVLVPVAIFAGIIAALLSSQWEMRLGHQTFSRKLGAVFVPGGIAALIYWFVALKFKVPAATEMRTVLFRWLKKGEKSL